MKKAADLIVMTSPEYRRFIEDLKARVICARISAARAANRDLILLYWDIGHGIVEKQQLLGWGGSVVEMVSADLRRAFPAMRGFSPFNLWRMRQLYLEYSASEFLAQAVPELKKHDGAFLAQVVPETSAKTAETGRDEILSQLVRELPWGHNLLIMSKVSDQKARKYYLKLTRDMALSRDMLTLQIKNSQTGWRFRI